MSGARRVGRYPDEVRERAVRMVFGPSARVSVAVEGDRVDRGEAEPQSRDVADLDLPNERDASGGVDRHRYDISALARHPCDGVCPRLWEKEER